MADILLSSAEEEQSERKAPSGASTNGPLRLRWRQEVQGRSLAASMAVVAVLMAAPLTKSELPLSASPPTIMTDEVDVESATAAPKPAVVKNPMQRSTPTSEVVAPVTQPTMKSGPAPQARATPISNTSTINSRCSEILASAQLGEPLSNELRTFFQEECQ